LIVNYREKLRYRNMADFGFGPNVMREKEEEK